jgi:PIN domain nuclease of toxin-antitoxin system
MDKILLDTNILIKIGNSTLSNKGRKYIVDSYNELYFSSISVWEVAIKFSLGKKSFAIDPEEFYYGVLSGNARELSLTTAHVLGVASLPFVNKDPFDRILIAQAFAEDMRFLTTDKKLKGYSKSIIIC